MGRITLILGITFALFILGMDVNHCVFAQKTTDNLFGSNTSFDVYLANNSSGSDTIIRDVDIFGLQEIYGKTFMVVQPHGFNLKNAKGYILFDAIMAVLPKQEFKVQKSFIKN